MTATVLQMHQTINGTAGRTRSSVANATWDEALAGWAGWCRAGGHSELTIALRRDNLLKFATLCGKPPLEVTLADCAVFTGAPGLAANSRKVRRGSLRSFFVYAVSVGLVDTDPTLKLPKPRAPRGLPKPTPDHLFEKAIASASDRDRLILLLGALAGLRRAEIATLRWDDVSIPNDSIDGHLRVTGKGDKTRVVPLHPDLARALIIERMRRNRGRFGTGFRYQPEGPGSPWVFPGQSGGHLAPNAIGRIATGLLGGQATCHTLRHRFGVLAYQRGGHDLLAVSALLGHASVATTQGYASASAAALTAAVMATR